MFTVAPLTFICPPAFKSMPWLASIFTASCDVISTPLPLNLSLPLLDWMVMSPSAWMVIVLALASKVRLFFRSCR